MTKTFCDRCGKEISEGLMSKIKILEKRHNFDGDYEFSKTYDVCVECAKDIRQSIEKEETP